MQNKDNSNGGGTVQRLQKSEQWHSSGWVDGYTQFSGKRSLGQLSWI